MFIANGRPTGILIRLYLHKYEIFSYIIICLRSIFICIDQLFHSLSTPYRKLTTDLWQRHDISLQPGRNDRNNRGLYVKDLF
jgi:hypothetical protein